MVGCSSDEAPRGPEDRTASSAPQDAAPAEPRYELDNTAEKIVELVGEEDSTPTTANLPETPDGFRDAEAVALAERAIDLVTRGVAPRLTKMSPSSAFEYVFATQYPATTESARAGTASVAGKYDWEWAWASRFESEPPLPSRFLVSRWQVERVQVPGSGKALRVTLSVAVEHLVPDHTGTRRGVDSNATTDPIVLHPIVMQRTVIIQGFRPLGGPRWWPGVGLQARPLFGGQCAPINGSVLTPATRTATLDRGFDILSDFVENPRSVEIGASSDASDLAELVNEYCED